MENNNILNSLPADIKKVVQDSSLPSKIQTIGEKYGLHIDQIGVLDQEIAYVMTGSSHLDDFVERVEDNLNVSTEIAIEIATDVNMEIFLPIRESLANMYESPVYKQNPEENLSRENILAEVENPTPTVQPISRADQTVAGPAQRREVTEQISPTSDDGIAQDFISGKLTGTVNLPAKKAVTTPESLTSKPTQKPSAKTDPYREPLA